MDKNGQNYLCSVIIRAQSLKDCRQRYEKRKETDLNAVHRLSITSILRKKKLIFEKTENMREIPVYESKDSFGNDSTEFLYGIRMAFQPLENDDHNLNFILWKNSKIIRKTSKKLTTTGWWIEFAAVVAFCFFILTLFLIWHFRRKKRKCNHRIRYFIV